MSPVPRPDRVGQQAGFRPARTPRCAARPAASWSACRSPSPRREAHVEAGDQLLQRRATSGSRRLARPVGYLQPRDLRQRAQPLPAPPTSRPPRRSASRPAAARSSPGVRRFSVGDRDQPQPGTRDPPAWPAGRPRRAPRRPGARDDHDAADVQHRELVQQPPPGSPFLLGGARRVDRIDLDSVARSAPCAASAAAVTSRSRPWPPAARALPDHVPRDAAAGRPSGRPPAGRARRRGRAVPRRARGRPGSAQRRRRFPSAPGAAASGAPRRPCGRAGRRRSRPPPWPSAATAVRSPMSIAPRCANACGPTSRSRAAAQQRPGQPARPAVPARDAAAAVAEPGAARSPAARCSRPGAPTGSAGTLAKRTSRVSLPAMPTAGQLPGTGQHAVRAGADREQPHAIRGVRGHQGVRAYLGARAVLLGAVEPPAAVALPRRERGPRRPGRPHAPPARRWGLRGRLPAAGAPARRESRSRRRAPRPAAPATGPSPPARPVRPTGPGSARAPAAAGRAAPRRRPR